MPTAYKAHKVISYPWGTDQFQRLLWAGDLKGIKDRAARRVRDVPRLGNSAELRRSICFAIAASDSSPKADMWKEGAAKKEMTGSWGETEGGRT